MTSLLKLEITVVFWLLLPVYSGSLKRIDYPKQICLAHPLSFECFYCSLRNSLLYCYLIGQEVSEEKMFEIDVNDNDDHNGRRSMGIL